MTTTITKATCRAVRVDLDAALAEIGARFGIELKAGGIRFDAGSIRIAVEGKVAGLAIDQTDEGRAFVALAHTYGLKPEHLGVEVIDGAKRLTVVGLNISAPKNPVVLRDEAGKTYKAPPAYLLARLRAAA